jgi:hypothetical protein
MSFFFCNFAPDLDDARIKEQINPEEKRSDTAKNRSLQMKSGATQQRTDHCRRKAERHSKEQIIAEEKRSDTAKNRLIQKN